jgi:hypothetical protein
MWQVTAPVVDGDRDRNPSTGRRSLTSWSKDEGPEIRGPNPAILLLLTGPPAGLSQLTPDGAAVLACEAGTHPNLRTRLHGQNHLTSPTFP